MPSSNSWKQAYLLQADRLMSGIENTGNPDTITAADIANADFRKKLKASPVSLHQPDYVGPEAQAGNELDARVKAGGFDGFLAQTEKVANTPVIKEALNVLSTGAYATANTADNVLDGARELRDGNLRGISDIAMALPTGLAQGVNAGIGQSKEDATLWGDVIKHGITDLGRDPNSDASKWVEGIGGFVGDVALDPTTYLSLGTTAVAKGAIAGAKEAGKASKSLAETMLKNGTHTGESFFRDGKNVGPTVSEVANNTRRRFSNAVVEAIRSNKDWKAAEIARKAERRAIKSDTSKATPLPVQDFGTDIAAFHNSTLENEAASAAPALAKLATNLPVDESGALKAPSITEVLDEVKANVDKPVKTEVLPKVEEPKAPVNNLDAALKNEPLIKAEVPAPKSPEAIHSNMVELGKQLRPIASRFVKPHYVGPIRQALSDPSVDLSKIIKNPAHKSMTPDELLQLSKPMTDNEVTKLIMKEDNGLNRAELRSLREFTGKTDKAEVAAEFISRRKKFTTYRDNYRKTKLKEATQAKPKLKNNPRQETIASIIADHPVQPTAENIAQAQKDATEAAQAVVDHPDALSEAVQHSHRVEEYHKALKDVANIEPSILRFFGKSISTEPSEAIVEGGKLIRQAGHDAAVAAIREQFKDAPFKTKQGFRTMTEDKLTGSGWKPESWSSNSQLALYKAVLDKTLEVVENNQPYLKTQFFMNALRIADTELRAMGIEPFLNHVDSFAGKSAGKFVVNLSAYDILHSLQEVDSKSLTRLLFDGQQNGYTLTQIQGAVESMIKLRHAGVEEEKVARAVRSNLLNSQAKNGRPVRNDAGSVGVRDAKTGALSAAEGRALGTGATRAKLDAAIKKGVPAEKAMINQARNAGELSKLITDPRVYQKLNYNMLVNHAAHASKLGQDIEDLSNATILQMAELSKEGGPGEVLKKFFEIRNSLTSNKGFNKADFETARQGFDAKLTTLITESERYVIDTAKKRSVISAKPVKTPKEADKVQAVVNTTHAEDAAKAEVSAAALIEEARTVPGNVVPEGIADQTVDLMNASISSAALRKAHPILKLIDPALGMDENVIRAIQSGSHSIGRQQAYFHETLGNYVARYSGEQLAVAFHRLQELGRDATQRANGAILLPENEPEMVRELYGIIGTMMEVSAQNVFARNGIGISHFNKLAQAANLSDSWRFVEGKTAVENGHLWTEWQDIEEKGVQDFLSRMHSITIKASQEIAIAADFSMRFGSKTNEGGKLVKIVWKNKKEDNASFYDLIDKNLYYPRELTTQIVNIDRLMNESRTVSQKHAFGRFITNVFDPITNALKASQTTVRPGHWVISVVGDLLRNQIAGVNSIQPYRHSVAIMKAAKIDMKDFIGHIESAEALTKYRSSQAINNGFKTTTGKGVILHVGGQKHVVSYEDLYRLMNDVVMLPKHRGAGGVLEDRFVGEAVTSKFAHGLEKATDAVTDNSKFSLNEKAAMRDNFMRIALAIDFASKRQFKDLKEMKSAMEGHVTKWAPTSTDMTAFESKYARRTMLYYTWLRGITPRIIDSAMTKPGVTTMVPKALYNVAYANGLNPESIGNPFPEDDGLFPSYYYNNVLGPQWKDDFGMWGINPSSPVIEVANTFSRINPGDPVGNVTGTASQLLGMATPFIKMPTEMAMGANSSGIPITDQSQYLLDNLGGSYVGALSRATGKTLNQNGIVDRTDSAAKATPEDQAAQAKLQAFNFLTGLKLTDFKSQSAQRAALFDQKDALKTEATNLRRSQ